MIYVYIGIGLFLLYLLINLIVFLFIFYRPKPLDLTTILPFEYKEKVYEGIKSIENKPVKEISILSHDGLKLVGYLFEIPNPESIIILVHGYGSNGFQDFGSVFDFYQSFKQNILIVSQRAHNKSEGKFCTYGIKESMDIENWVQFVNKLYPNLPIRFSGISLGSSTILFAKDKKLPNVISMVSDCGFISPIEEIKHVAKRVYHLPPFLFIGVVGIYAKIFLKINIKQRITDSYNKTSIPVVFIHGKADNYVPFWMGEELYDKYLGPKEKLFIDNAKHGNSYFEDMDTVKKGICDFFLENK
ncbi:MAG: alpha/beta hydrolase [Acholeplasmatales bacterium]|jgi:fermentation-respiration switch protein FrsA (DUF1100 family)|nr:alpha/beta hydrolase [Acholeplasmatales bacterium]